VSKILADIRADFKYPIFLCLHRLKNISGGFQEALNIRSSLKIHEPIDKEMIKNGRVYLAPSNFHMLAEVGNSIALSVEDLHHFSRPSIDLTFDTFSFVYREKMLGIILSGANSDGAEGMFKCKQRGGYTIVQDPEEATVKTMVSSTLALIKPNKVLSTDEITAFLNALP
jgi:two-component system chemotaxis response regulator CheB